VAEVHMHNGYLPATAKKNRACCSCGYTTGPYPTAEEARHALLGEHPTDPPVCRLCGAARWDTDPLSGRWVDLEILTVSPDDQILACCTDMKQCRDRAAQRQLHLDRAAYDELGLDNFPAPKLRSADEGPRLGPTGVRRPPQSTR
jgi:hypothetical protein